MMWVKHPNFLDLRNSQTSDSLHIIFFKNENMKFWQFYLYVFFGGDICLTYQFLEDQKLNQERSCEVLKKIIILSDLTPDVRSYPVLRYLFWPLAPYLSPVSTTQPTSILPVSVTPANSWSPVSLTTKRNQTSEKTFFKKKKKSKISDQWSGSARNPVIFIVVFLC